MTCKQPILGLLVAIAGLCAPDAAVFARDILIVGDSTASTYGPEQYPRMGWGQVLGDFYAEDVTVTNLAQSGRSARSFISEGFFAELEKQLGADDILLIQFGHNARRNTARSVMRRPTPPSKSTCASTLHWPMKKTQHRSC